MIAIIGAMSIEIQSIKNAMDIITTLTISGRDYYLGKLSDRDIVLVNCGVGKVNAAICAEVVCLKFSPELIINPGVAGGIAENVNLGDLVVGSYCLQHDMDTSLVGDKLGTIFLKDSDLIDFPCNKERLDLFITEGKSIYPGKVHYGKIASGDQFIADEEKSRHIQDQFGAIACDMESAAIAHTAYVNNVDFVALRSISDNAYKHQPMDYSIFAADSAKKTELLLMHCLPKL